jgi:hypothetical protein
MKVTIQAGWDDVPHIADEAKREMLAAIPSYQRASRSKGIPDMGSGAVYPIGQEDYTTDVVPDPLWPRAYGLDVGWEQTAAVWLAFDPEINFAIAYDEYFRGQAEPAIHASAIKAKGDWIPGAIDPASAGSSQKDGEKLIEQYAELGLRLTPADNAVTAGTTLVYNVLSTGQLKISRRCINLLKQLKMYRRDERGRIVKKNDHGPDALRYACMTGPIIKRTKPAKISIDNWLRPDFNQGGWAG